MSSSSLSRATLFDTPQARSAEQSWHALHQLITGTPPDPADLQRAVDQYHVHVTALGVRALHALLGLDALEASAPCALPPSDPPPEPPPVAAAPCIHVDEALCATLKARLSGGAQLEATTVVPCELKIAAKLHAELVALLALPVETMAQADALHKLLDALLDEDGRWRALLRDDREALLCAVIALVRHAGEQLGPDKLRQRTNLRFKQINYIKEHGETGFLHGMAGRHAPAHGKTWREDAQHHLDLKQQAPTHPSAPEHAPEPATPAHEDAPTPHVAAPTPEVTSLTSPCPELVNQRWAIVGGDRRVHKLARYKKRFQLTRLDWLDTTKQKHKHIENLVRRMKHNSLDMVIVLQQFTTHSASDKISKYSKKTGVQVVWVEWGYGEEQIIAAIRRHLNT